MTKEEFKSFNLIGLFFVLSTILVGIPLYFLSPGQPLRDTGWHTASQVIWAICSGVSIYIATKTKGNYTGTFLCAIFGPITLLTIGMQGAYLKWWKK